MSLGVRLSLADGVFLHILWTRLLWTGPSSNTHGHTHRPLTAALIGHSQLHSQVAAVTALYTYNRLTHRTLTAALYVSTMDRTHVGLVPRPLTGHSQLHSIYTYNRTLTAQLTGHT